MDAFPGVASDGVPWLESFLTSGRGHSSDFVSPLWRGREEGDLPAGRNPDLSAEGGVDPYRRRLQGVDPEEGGEDPPAGAEGDDGTSVEDDDEDQDGIGGDTTDGIDMVLIIGIVIGSGVVTLIILCIVRKVNAIFTRCSRIGRKTGRDGQEGGRLRVCWALLSSVTRVQFIVCGGCRSGVAAYCDMLRPVMTCSDRLPNLYEYAIRIVFTFLPLRFGTS